MNGIDEAGTWAVRAPGVARQARRLARFFDGDARFAWIAPGLAPPESASGLAGWGAKGGARAEAQRRALLYLALEDGFLRGSGPGSVSWSLTADDIGVHYDSGAPSRLEALIEAWERLPAGAVREAEALIALMRVARLGKYNDAPDLPADHPLFQGRPVVIVADQVRGDASIGGGGCGPETFEAMLDAAVAENPNSRVVARVHPNRGGGRRGHLRGLATARGLDLLDEPASFISVAERAERVYVATSGAGMEALIAGTPVTCFGLPFYAGWGLTDDRRTCVRRTARPPLQALVAAAYVVYTRYLSPLTGRRCSALELAELLALRRRRDRETAGTLHVVGVPGWKRPAVKPFIQGARTRLSYAATAEEALVRQAADGGRVLAWAAKAPRDLAERCAAQGADLLRLEDGYLRSIGLGAAMTPPLSLVIDASGIYYDPSGPSDLETLLSTAEFGPALLARAAALRRRIVEGRLSKYNVGAEGGEPFATAGDRLRVLVPGQVEDDASVRLGAGEARDNLSLLKAVRRARPAAFIVYKPHPDVEAGLRPGRLDEGAVLQFANALAEDARMPDLLDACQELHTLTSLAGFEALLRGVPVSTYGQPFYAGWGLTTDACDFARRRRRLSLDALAAGALILYPRYADPRSGWPCAPEQAIDLLIARRNEPDALGDRLSLRARRGLARIANRKSLAKPQAASGPETARARA